MPNWTYNTLTITGTNESMDLFYQSALKPDSSAELCFSFSNIFPMPVPIKNTISPPAAALGKKWLNQDLCLMRDSALSDLLGEDHQGLIPVENNTPEKCQLLQIRYGADNWYDWNIINYGTKWDCEVPTDRITLREKNIFECSFETAWSPPSAFLYNLQNKFSDLEIKLIYELEGDDECGIFITQKDQSGTRLEHQQSTLEHYGAGGESIYYKDGDWWYEDGEVCEDYFTKNPFEEIY